MNLATASHPGQKTLFLPALFVAFSMSCLIGLGVWQLQRLSWKEALIAKIGERSKLPTVPLPAVSDWPNLRPDDYEYGRVEVQGDLMKDEIALVFRGTGGGTGIKIPGYLVFMPLKIQLPRNSATIPVQPAYVMVNRGFIPADHPELAGTEPSGGWTNVRINGLMRSPEERNFFTPIDKPEAGQYFTRDPKLMAEHFKLAEAAPFTIDEIPENSALQWPRAGTTEVKIPNNHLGYALTWFGLAIGCAGVFFAYIKAR